LKRLPLFEVTLIAVILILHAYAAFSDAHNFPNSWFTRDDAYYYFKVAQNITEGRGVTFDGINPTNGFHPLWMLICIPIFALARIDLILPLRVLLVIIAAMHAATAVLVYRLTVRVLARPIAMLAASFWAFHPYIHYTVYEFGLETPLAALAVVWTLYVLERFDDQWRAATVTSWQVALLAVAATIVVFSRLDLVFFAALVGLWIVFRGGPLRFLLPLDILLLLVGMLSSYAILTGFPAYFDYADQAILSAALSIIAKVPVFYFVGLYQHPRMLSPLALPARIIIAVGVGQLILAVVLLALQSIGVLGGMTGTVLMIDLIISLVVITAIRYTAFSFGDPEAHTHSETPAAEFRTGWRSWLTAGSLYYGILGGALASYVAWNKAQFGVFVPISAEIKHWWGGQSSTIYDGPPRDWYSFFGISLKSALNAWKPVSDWLFWPTRLLRGLMPGSALRDERYYLAFGIAVAAALALMLASRRPALRALTKLGLVPLAIGSQIQLLSYTATAYAGYKEWYWITQLIFLTLGASLILHLLARPLMKIKLGRATVFAGSAIASLLLAVTLGKAIISKMPYGSYSPDLPYMDALPFLEENTRPDALIGMTGGGNVGYFIGGRTIVNMDGLINSEPYFRALQEGNAAVFLRQRGVKIIFANPGLLALPPYDGQFAPYLERFASYGGKALMYLLPQPKY